MCIIRCMANGDEIWKAIPGFSTSYEVSNLGRVRSFRRDPQGHVLAQATNARGYKLVALLLDSGRQRSIGVHLLVLTAFVGPRPDGCFACHNNGRAADNGLTNLRWDTMQANVEDRKRHGWFRDPLTNAGERHAQSKLTDADAVAIFHDPRTRKVIADAYGVSPATVVGIKTGRNWNHATGMKLTIDPRTGRRSSSNGSLPRLAADLAEMVRKLADDAANDITNVDHVNQARALLARAVGLPSNT